MMRKYLLSCLLALPLLSMGQKTCKYDGERVRLSDNTVKVTHIGKLAGQKGISYQGMDIWGHTLVSLQHTGVATLYDFNGKSIKKKGQLKLASYDKTNHANVASFGTQYAQAGDPLPLLYVARCSGKKLRGMDNLFFVERIDPKAMKSELVQQIWLNDYKHHFGSYCLGAVDRQNRMLYMYAETTGRLHPGTNRHWVMQFRLPEYRGPQDSLVILTEDDALARYDMEDSYTFDHQPITQGATIYNGLLFLPMGVGSKAQPSLIYVMDTGTHRVQNVVNLQSAIPHELEDCTVWGGKMILQTQGDIYQLEF
ncbi:MAG: hypothetical protein PUH21_05150 [Prevotellaceae bacterium]|nr:hypothetical protein [Prevotellaceae bacterium]MDY3856201.1 hypothetical protein [Bacteroidaceae bacterium]